MCSTEELDLLKAAYNQGSWEAWDAILHWINTQPEQIMDKKKLYHAVMNMRPNDPFNKKHIQSIQHSEANQ